jgi:hypothetical protein
MTGMAATTGMGSYPHAGTDAMAHGHNSRLGSQWSFSRQDLPQISEMGMIPPDIGESIIAGGLCNSSSDGGAQSSPYLSRNFSVSSWDDTNNPIMFSSPSKKVKVDAADDMVSGFSNIDYQVCARRHWLAACWARQVRCCADEAWSFLLVWAVKVVVGDVRHG